MIIEYDCGCVVEYRQSFPSACLIREADISERVDGGSKTGYRPTEDYVKSMGESIGLRAAIQCTWFTPCAIHHPNQEKFRVE